MMNLGDSTPDIVCALAIWIFGFFAITFSVIYGYIERPKHSDTTDDDPFIEL